MLFCTSYSGISEIVYNFYISKLKYFMFYYIRDAYSWGFICWRVLLEFFVVVFVKHHYVKN